MQWLFLFFVVLVLMLIAVSGWWVAISTATRVTTGALIVVLAFLVETSLVIAPWLNLGIRVNSNDLILALLGVAVIGRVMFMAAGGQQKRWFIVWVAFLGVLLLSLLIGLFQYGSKAGVEVRDNFYFLMAGLYFASFTYTEADLKRLWRITQWCAWLVVAIVAYRWVGLKYGFVSERLVEYVGASSEFRVVGSSPTFFLASVGVAYFAFWFRDGRSRALFGALVMLGLAIVLQHRSVWVAGIGALAVIAWHLRAAIRARAFSLGVIFVLAGAVLTAYLAYSPSSRLIETLTKSVVAVSEARGTHTERIEGWKVLLGDYAGYKPREWLLGKPYGAGYERYVAGRLVEFSPHNFFIQLLLRVGAIGVGLFLLVHFSLHVRVRRCLKQASADTTAWAICLAILVANILYYIPYQGFYLQGAFYGVLIGYFSSRLPVAAKAGRPLQASFARAQ